MAKAKDPEFNRALAVAIHGNPDANVSNAQLAAFLGLAPSTASRLRNKGQGGQGAGWGTLMAVRAKLPAASLNDLFESDVDLDAKLPPLVVGAR
jgi:hypothetical protein